MPRILLIEEDEQYRRLVRQHLSILAGSTDVVEHVPSKSGPLPTELSGAGYDCVMLGAFPGSHAGLSWLADLTGRPHFPPILYFAAAGEETDGADLKARGAFGVLSKAKIDHAQLKELLEAALAHRRNDLKTWKLQPDYDKAYRFGDTLIRGERCVRQLAASALSTVYLAESEKVGRLVVLKIFGQVPDRTEKNNTFDRFLQEYQIIAGIAHPNVVRIYDLGVADDHAYITMEYFPSGDLRQRIRRGLDPSLAGGMLKEMAEALAAIHSVGVLHRDLKPGNVMLRSDGTIVLIDFGLAKQVELEAEITATGEIFGTPYYMSPEQGHGREVDERSDIYSLGVIFYEMLTAQKPYLAPTPMAVIYKHSHAPVPELPARLSHWQGVLAGMMAKKPEDRYASAREVAAAVDAVLAQGSAPR